MTNTSFFLFITIWLVHSDNTEKFLFNLNVLNVSIGWPLINAANGSAYMEYKGSKVMVAVYGPKDIQRREDFTLDGFIKVDLSYCLFAKPVKRALPTDLKDIERYQATQLTEALSSVVQLKRYNIKSKK